MEGQRHGKPKELHTSRVVNSKFRPEDRRKKERKKRSRVLERVHLASSSILTDILIFILLPGPVGDLSHSFAPS
jgi:hypothetical protein